MGQTSRGFSRNELRELLVESGLQEVSCRPLAPETDAKGPALLLATAVTPLADDAPSLHPPTQKKSQSHQVQNPKGKS